MKAAGLRRAGLRLGFASAEEARAIATRIARVQAAHALTVTPAC